MHDSADKAWLPKELKILLDCYQRTERKELTKRMEYSKRLECGECHGL